MSKDENGYIVVETVGTFIPFVLLITSILSLVNIVTSQTRIHYALTQSANTLSMYSYSLKVIGLDEILMEIDTRATEVREAAEEFKVNINDVLEGIDSLSPDGIVASGEAAANQVGGWGESIVDDPKEVMQLLLNYGLGEVSNAGFGRAVQKLVGKYLANGNMSGDEYLRSVNVIDGLNGLDFYGGFKLFDLDSSGGNSSVLLDKDGNVKLVIQYEIEYKFGALPLPFEPKLKVKQSVKTKAWLGGSGDGYMPPK